MCFFSINGYMCLCPQINTHSPLVAGLLIQACLLLKAYLLLRVSHRSIPPPTHPQVSFIVGIAAPPEFIDEVKAIVESHNNNMVLDRILAFHFGQRYMVRAKTAEAVVKHASGRFDASCIRCLCCI